MRRNSLYFSAPGAQRVQARCFLLAFEFHHVTSSSPQTGFDMFVYNQHLFACADVNRSAKCIRAVLTKPTIKLSLQRKYSISYFFLLRVLLKRFFIFIWLLFRFRIRPFQSESWNRLNFSRHAVAVSQASWRSDTKMNAANHAAHPQTTAAVVLIMRAIAG